MPTLIFENGPEVHLTDNEHATAYGACETLASICETDANQMTRDGRHATAAALRESAMQYRAVSVKLQGVA